MTHLDLAPVTGHHAIFYRDEQEYVDRVGRWVADLVTAGRKVLVAVPPDRQAWLVPLLVYGSDQVAFVDITDLGRNPCRIIPATQSFLDQHDDRSVAVVGEVAWAGRTAEEHAETMRHEALVNLAFPDTTTPLLCPYDLSSLPPEIIDSAARTHPRVYEDPSGPETSTAYTDPRAFLGAGEPPEPPPAAARTLAFGVGMLIDVRRLVTAAADAAGICAERTGDAVLAASELATNSICHGGGSGVLRAWSDDRGLVCEVSDRGAIEDPLAGRRLPRRDADAGWGLWLANQVVDLLRLHTGAAGTVIRFRVDR